MELVFWIGVGALSVYLARKIRAKNQDLQIQKEENANLKRINKELTTLLQHSKVFETENDVEN